MCLRDAGTSTDKLNNSVDLSVVYKGLFGWVSHNHGQVLQLNLPYLDQGRDRGEAK